MLLQIARLRTLSIVSIQFIDSNLVEIFYYLNMSPTVCLEVPVLLPFCFAFLCFQILPSYTESVNWQVLVIANPANTNALILKESAPSIPAKSITCLTRLDHNRALSHIADRLNVQASNVKNVIIWGNHSSSQYPDAHHAIAITSIGEKSVKELIADDHW